MDLLMHAIVGFFLANIISEPSQATYYLLIFASVFPDLDLVYILLGKLSYFKHHRKLTHSIIGMVFFSAVISFFFKDKELAFALSMLAMGVHVLLDLTNHFGTAILYPFRKKRYSWELTNVVEPQLYILFAGLAALFFFYPKDHVSILAMIVLSIYVLLKAALHRIAKNYAMMRYGKSKALPHFWNIFRWHIIHEEGDRYILSDLDLIAGKIKRAKAFKKAPESMRYLDKKMNSFFDFAIYPIIEEGKGEIKVKDLRFFASEHFMIILKTDAEGNILNKFKS